MNDRIVFLRGKKTILRPYEEEKDLRSCTRWINDPEVRRWVRTQFPMALHHEKELMERSHGTDGMRLIIETLEGKPIGCMGLDIHWMDRTASTGAFIGEAEFRGQGYGSDAKFALLKHAFDTLGMRKITASVLAPNERSLAYMKKNGYSVEGVRRKEILHDGKYVDLLLTAVFKSEFKKAYRAYMKM